MKSSILFLVLATGVCAVAHQVGLVTEQLVQQVPPPVVPVLPTPQFTSKTMPKVSTTLLCIINLATQFFLIYTALAVVRTLNQQYGNIYKNAERLCATACTTVVYAPVLSVLFLGCRMRAIQLAQGETEKYELPQPWVQTAMQVASWAVLGQVILVLLIPLVTGEMAVEVDADGNVDLDKLGKAANQNVMAVLTIFKFGTMFALYTGVAVVIIGIFVMEPPVEIWGKDGGPPVSPAVSATINLSCQFLVVYLLAAVVRTLKQFQGPNPTYLKLESALSLAQFTVNFAPMLCVLFIGARMRALQMDPKNGAPQAWAQNCFFLCAYSVMFQTLMVIAMPFIYPKVVCKQGAFEGDVVFV